MIEDGASVYPGCLLVANTQELKAADGTHEYLGKIYSSVTGHVKILPRKTWHNKDDFDKISVICDNNQLDDQPDASSAEKVDLSQRQPMTADIVYGRVTKVEDRFAKIDILAIGEVPLNAVFVGIIQQENVRDFERSEVQMHLSFRPGDVIRARVTQGVESGGTSRDASVLLSTAEEELGVIFARS